jgi:ABC-2 type transport system ATP-binding protein
MSDWVMQAEDLGKRYRVRREQSVLLSLAARSKPVDFWALRHANLEVSKGEVLAIVGRNGAGKSTLLRLTAGVSRPTEGRVERPERTAPLIEVGAGFHPELSGRENVEINGRLLGMSRKQVKSRFDEIVDFAELSASIDRPIKEYSTGMYMRLGFAVAVHTDPQLLIVDEVLAVGDLPFQARCLDRIKALRDTGTGVLFVSHNLSVVLELADKAILLVKGEQVAAGDPREVVAAYHQSIRPGSNATTTDGIGMEIRSALQVHDISVVDETGSAASLWHPGDWATVILDVEALEDIDGILPGFRLSKRGLGVVSAWHGATQTALDGMAKGEKRRLQVRLRLNVTAGEYALDLAFASPDWSQMWLDCNDAVTFAVSGPTGLSGLAFLDSSIELDPQ